MSVTRDTSQSPIGPCVPSVQYPCEDFAKHSRIAFTSSSLFCGANSELERMDVAKPALTSIDVMTACSERDGGKNERLRVGQIHLHNTCKRLLLFCDGVMAPAVIKVKMCSADKTIHHRWTAMCIEVMAMYLLVVPDYLIINSIEVCEEAKVIIFAHSTK